MITEEQLQAAAVAPRVTKEHIEKLVATLKVSTYLFPDTTYTTAIAQLPSGFVAGTGSSACVNKANFNADFGVDMAVESAISDARKKLWELEGYVLASGGNSAAA